MRRQKTFSRSTTLRTKIPKIKKQPKAQKSVYKSRKVFFSRCKICWIKTKWKNFHWGNGFRLSLRCGKNPQSRLISRRKPRHRKDSNKEFVWEIFAKTNQWSLSNTKPWRRLTYRSPNSAKWLLKGQQRLSAMKNPKRKWKSRISLALASMIFSQ